MRLVYNVIVHLSWFLLKIVALFHSKLQLFVNGRKQTFPLLSKAFPTEDRVIWMHVASLGEFEQGLPVLEVLKKEYRSHKMLVTFFSPSGYEVKKNASVADAIVYLPMDTRKNVVEFMALVRPKLALFVKYEIWPNYLSALKKEGIPTFLISAIFRKEQIYFKWYGKLLRNALFSFSHIFLQDEKSKVLLEGIGLTNTTLSGDTRFDRVSEILERDNTLPFMEKFKGTNRCFVGGSTWPEDEELLIDYINNTQDGIKFVLAPHNIKEDHIKNLEKGITKSTIRYSNREGRNLKDFDVLIIDTIGLLTRIYSYADLAYVGGGFSTGLHNTLEPAVFGIPIIIGPNYQNFNEAITLVEKKGILSVASKNELENVLNSLLQDESLLKKTGEINSTFVKKNKGASIPIMQYIRKSL